MNVSKPIDFRVFLVPHKVNTLAHYIAMYDDVYCQSIYLAFLENPIFYQLNRDKNYDMQLKDMLSGFSGPKVDEWSRMLNLTDDLI